MDAQEAVLRAQIPGHAHEWAEISSWVHVAYGVPGSTDVHETCGCGEDRWRRGHPFGVVIPDPDSKEQ